MGRRGSMRRVAGALLGFVLVVCASPTASLAEQNEADGGTITDPPGIYANVRIYSGGYRGGAGSGCSYTPWYGDTSLDGKSGARQASKLFGVDRALGYNKVCPGDVLNPTTGNLGTFIWIYDPGPGGPVKPALERVEKLLTKPVAQFAPKADRGIVKVGQWFWAEPLAPVQATAVVEFPLVFATVTATPTRLIFDSGEPGGEPVICDAPGRKWLPEYGDELPSDCMYEYFHSSKIADNGKTFKASLSVEWEVTVVTSSRSLRTLDPPLVTTTSVDMVVKELQAIIVYGGTND
jgi:hypothetical protein